MARYRFLAYDLVSGTLQAELPLGNVTYGEALNGSAPFRADLPVTDSIGHHLAATAAERCLIHVERDGVIVPGASAIVWRRVRQSNAEEMRVQLYGATIPSFLFRQRIIADLSYSATDQFTIAQGLINHMQGQTGANLGIVVGVDTCGVTRDRTYNAYERKNIGEALSQLGSVIGGFDWALHTAWVSNVPVTTLHLGYPRRGRIAGATGVQFIGGKNIITLQYDEDGSRSARAVDALGAGDGSDMRVSTAQRVDLLDLGFPLTTEQIAWKDVTVQATLDAYATSAVNARAATPTFITLQVDPDDPESGLGVWIVGDDTYIEYSDALLPRGTDDSPGLATWKRIIGYEMTVSPDGNETLNVTLGELVVAS